MVVGDEEEMNCVRKAEISVEEFRNHSVRPYVNKITCNSTAIVVRLDFGQAAVSVGSQHGEFSRVHASRPKTWVIAWMCRW